MSITKDLTATAIIGSSVIAGLVTGPLIGATIGGVNGHTHEDETQAYFDKYYFGASDLITRPDMLDREGSWLEGTNPLANYLHKVVEKNTGSEGLAKTIAMAGGILSGLVAGILQGPVQGFYFGERLVNKLDLI